MEETLGGVVFRIMVGWSSYSFCLELPAQWQGVTGQRKTATASWPKEMAS